MNAAPISVNRHSSPEERQAALRQIYQQVLERQPYFYEREILAKAEKDFLSDKIGVRRFIKELANSEVYLNAFYETASGMKFLDLCFKHFLGRAPLSQEETNFYTNILLHQGSTGLITAMLDSEEYRKAFGCFTVPYPQPQKCYASPNAYLETTLLNQEHIGQQNWAIPLQYRRRLGLNFGDTRHPEADEPIETKVTQADLAKLLELLQSVAPEKVVAALTPQQRERLRQAIR